MYWDKFFSDSILQWLEQVVHVWTSTRQKLHLQLIKPYFQRHRHHNISDLAQEVNDTSQEESDFAQEVGDIAQETQTTHCSRSLLRHNKIAKSANQHRECFCDF